MQLSFEKKLNIKKVVDFMQKLIQIGRTVVPMQIVPANKSDANIKRLTSLLKQLAKGKPINVGFGKMWVCLLFVAKVNKWLR